MSSRAQSRQVYRSARSKLAFAGKETSSYTFFANEGESGDGGDDPMWKFKTSAGIEATNAYGFSGTRYILGAGSWSASAMSRLDPKLSYNEYGSGNYRTPGTSFGAISDVDGRTKADNDALRNVYKQIDALTTSFRSGTFLGELHKSLKMIARPAVALRKEWDDYTYRAQKALSNEARGIKRQKSERYKAFKRRVREAQRKAVAKTYLEAVFGWMPLVSDIENGMAALAAISNNDRSTRTRVTGQAQSVVDSPVSSQPSQVGTFYCETVTSSYTQTSGYRYVCGVNRSATSGKMTKPEKLGKLGLNLRNFAPTMYELLPYSWIVDYFSNVGDIVNAACTDTSAVTWICLSTRTVSERTVTATVDYAATKQRCETYDLDLTSAAGGITTRSRRTQISRARLSRIPFPSLTVGLPNLRQFVNLAAFMASK